MTQNQPPFCTDPSYDLQGLRFVDAIKPCPQLAVSVPALYAYSIFMFFLFGFFKKKMMQRLGVEREDIEIIMSSRQVLEKSPLRKQTTDIESSYGNEGFSDDCDGKDTNGENNGVKLNAKGDASNGSLAEKYFDLNELIEKYGDKKLRWVDSIPRKTAHVIGIAIAFVQILFTTQTVLTQLQTLCFASSILGMTFIVFNSCMEDSWFAKNLFALSRIRDGKYARTNLCTSLSLGAVGTLFVLIIVIYGIVPHINNPSLQVMVANLVYAPLIFGDAMGELIGGPFGGTFVPTFQVRGFGEINRKSVEGCFAVFCGSFVGCVGTYYMYGANSTSWLILSLSLAVITTVVEAVAFRSTDNFFIPVVNAGIVVLALGPFGEAFTQ